MLTSCKVTNFVENLSYNSVYQKKSVQGSIFKMNLLQISLGIRNKLIKELKSLTNIPLFIYLLGHSTNISFLCPLVKQAIVYKLAHSLLALLVWAIYLKSLSHYNRNNCCNFLKGLLGTYNRKIHVRHMVSTKPQKPVFSLFFILLV